MGAEQSTFNVDGEGRPQEGRGPATISGRQANLIILLLAVIADVTVWNSFRPVTKWEYKVEAVPDLHFEEGVNVIGEDGWEIVFARRASSGEGSSANFSYEMIFKRPKR